MEVQVGSALMKVPTGTSDPWSDASASEAAVPAFHPMIFSILV